jgi:hypothetical protein
MNARPDISRFSIYCQPSTEGKRRKEAGDILHLLWRLDEFIKLSDVLFGLDPPDFVFQYREKQIGAELTDLDPNIFVEGGHLTRGNFNKWQTGIEADAAPHEFGEWGKYSLRESLDAFRIRLNIKRQGAKHWFKNFSERWLLMHVSDGSPFAEILCGERQTALGMEAEAANYFGKATHAIDTICRDIQPFDLVLLFQKTDLATTCCNLLTFPANAANPHKLPVSPDEILKCGAAASDRFLDWKWKGKTIITTRRVKFGRS